MKKPTIVLGLGNPLMSDEGIGIFLINRLTELSEQFPEVDFFDAGTGGITLLHLFEGRDRAIIIDCAYMDEEPGRIRRFTPDQVKSVKQLAHQSLHEQDIMKIIEMAKLMEQCPKEVILFGIQPKSLELGEGISSELEQNIDDYIKVICNEL
ncbi:MAG: HyaD/HybD family hydrogenase maturation endopeptidase [Sedimentisphaerales bacterium]|nr:HyaD/HybD family hydrogenase maturation endopeptidase [Sedimentisphaerales bacterium]